MFSDHAGCAATSSIFFASKPRSRARTLQAIRASLLASAIASTLVQPFLGRLDPGLEPVALPYLRFNQDYRSDGMDTFLPPEAEYDLERARQPIYGEVPLVPTFAGRPLPLPPSSPDDGQKQTEFPALVWLDQILAKAPDETRKVLAFMPVHVGTAGDDALDLCKMKIAEIGRRRGASIVDWRIPSSITRENSNYWDALHYRVPTANKTARDLTGAVLSGAESTDGTYRLVNVP